MTLGTPGNARHALEQSAALTAGPRGARLIAAGPLIRLIAGWRGDRVGLNRRRQDIVFLELQLFVLELHPARRRGGGGTARTNIDPRRRRRRGRFDRCGTRFGGGWHAVRRRRLGRGGRRRRRWRGNRSRSARTRGREGEGLRR